MQTAAGAVARLPWSSYVATLFALLLCAPPRVSALTFANASTGLPATHLWDCNPVSRNLCNNTEDTGGWSGVAMADIDGDGLDDVGANGRLLYGFRAWLSDGTGSWSPVTTGFDLGECHGRGDVDFADVDGDSDPDFGSIAWINGRPVVFLNDGAGNWTESSTGLDAGGGEGFTFGDFDGDGRTDLATDGHFSGGVHAFLGDGLGGWTESSAGLPPGPGGHKVTSGDFDGDGRDELVDTLFMGLSSPLTGGVHVWSYGLDGVWVLVAEFPFNQPYGVDTGDIDADGHLNLVAVTSQDDVGTSGSVWAWLGDGAFGFTESITGLPVRDTFYADVALGDMDNDGDLDIVAGTWSGVIRLFLREAGGTWTEPAGTGLPTDLDNVEGLAVGDMDGDCRLDIAFAAYTCGLQVYRQADPPPCPILPEAGPALTVCAGASVVLDASFSRLCGCAPGEERFRWWADTLLVRDWDPSPTVTVIPDATTVYRLDAACSTDLGCRVSDTVLVTVVPEPSPAIDPANPTVCDGESVPLTVAGTWTDIRWTTDPAGQPGDGATTASIDVGPSETTRYSVAVTDTLGCAGGSDTLVTVVPQPSPVIDPADPTLCEGELETLTVAGTWTDIRWTTDPPGQPGDGATSVSIDVDPSETTRYSVTVADLFGCTGGAETLVTIVPNLVPPALGNVLRLVDEPPEGIHHHWVDLTGSWGDYQVLALPASLGPPSAASFELMGGLVATAPDGAEQVLDGDGLVDPPEDLVFHRIRATSLCNGTAGPLE